MVLRSPRWAAAALALVATLFVVVGGHAYASDSARRAPFDPYLHRPTGAMADPINLVFRGATADTAAAAVKRALGWGVVAGSQMTFMDRGTTRTTAWQLGLDLGRGNRYHMRLESVPSLDGQSYVLAGVHRDDLVVCGHVGHNFDATRDLVAGAFRALGYPVAERHFHNTLPGRQCDGSMTAGDGYVAFINLATLPRKLIGPIFPVGSLFPPAYVDLTPRVAHAAP